MKRTYLLAVLSLLASATFAFSGAVVTMAPKVSSAKQAESAARVAAYLTAHTIDLSTAVSEGAPSGAIKTFEHAVAADALTVNLGPNPGAVAIKDAFLALDPNEGAVRWDQTTGVTCGSRPECEAAGIALAGFLGMADEDLRGARWFGANTCFANMQKGAQTVWAVIKCD
jgi:hypothetical protein